MTRRGWTVLALFGAILFGTPAAGAGPLGLVPITPCRVVDTRNPNGPLGGPALSANETRPLPLTDVCGVPPSALGLVVNITVVDPAAAGFAQLYAGDTAAPGTSDLSFRAGRTRASNTLVALAHDGTGTVALANVSPGAAHYVLDLLGYFVTACTNTITVTNPAVATGPVATPFSQTFTQSGGTGTATFTTAGPLPPGLLLAPNGTLSGTPTQPGSFPITVVATDAIGCTGTGPTYTLVITCQTISVTNPATVTGTANAPFSQTFTQTGGVGTTTFSTSSPLPIGLTLAANGVLSGTPTQAGGFPIVVVATDANGCTGAGATYNLVINCQTISVTNPATASGTANAPFSQTFTQAGAIGSATFTTASTLPAGLSLATNGVLSGTPTQTGTFPIVVTVTDGNLCTGTSATYNLVIGCQTISVTNPATATGTANTPFSQTFTQAGAIGSATFTTASTLPNGLTLAANGTLSGTPTQTGTFPIVVTVTDANGCPGVSATYNLVIACQTFTVNPASLPQGTTGVAYPAVVFSHTGGIGAVTFALTGALPSGMNFTPGAATLDGLPTQSGSFPVTVTATDANGCTASRDYLLVVVCSGSSITLAPDSLSTVTVNTAFTPVIFIASGGTGPYTFAKAGTLPNGMNFNAGTATLDGTPTETGSFAITISATDTVGLCVGGRDYVINVTCSGVTITVAPPSLPAAPAGAPYGPVTFTASGGTGPHTFALTGALPTGMTFTGDVLSGTPTESGTFPLTVTATDANGCVGSTTYSLVITCPIITVTNPGTATGTVSTPFSQTFTQSGGALPITFSLASGSLPTGLTLDSSTGVLSGTPTQSGSFPITVKATDVNGCTGTGPTYTLVISCQTITVTNPVVNSGADGAPFLQTFTQTGAIGGATFTLASGAPLPAGWSLTTAGVLANAAPTPVQFTITVLVTDGNGCTGTGASYTVAILPAAANDTYAPAIVGNMSIDTATGTTFSVLGNDSLGTTAAIFAPAAHGTVVMNADGTFTYAPDRGYEGPDSFQYKATHTASGLTSAAATVSLTVTGVVWFVNDNPGACPGSCDGRRATPYPTLAAFQAVNDGTGTNPKTNHRIFLYESNPPNPYVGPVTLLNGQSLIGQDFTGTFATATGLAVPDTTVAVPVMDAANGPITEVTNGVAANAINLVTDDSVIGLKASATSGIAISQAAVPPGPGSAPLGVTTLMEVDIATAGTGTALSVLSTTGSLTYASGSVVASGSNGVSAVFIQGGTSAITINVPITSNGAGNVSISQRAAGAMTIFGGSITMTGAATGIFVGGPSGANLVSFNGLVQLGLNAGSRMTGAGQPAVSVNHSGTGSTTTFASLSIFTNLLTGIDAQNGGTLNVTAGVVDVLGQRAIRIDGAGAGMALGITLSGITQSGGSGGGPGVSLNNVSGSLTNTGSTSLANTSTQGISISGSSATINFGSTTITAPTTQGILVGTTTGNVSFGNTLINGGTDAVSLQNNSGGTRTFGTLTIGNVTSPTGVGFLHAVGGGNTTVTGAATITNPGGLGVSVEGLSGTQAINFNSTLSVTKGAAGTAVSLGTTASNSLTGTLNLGTLSVSTSSGTAILAGSAAPTSTPLTTSGPGLVTATGGPAINATNTTFNAAFGDVSSTNSTTQGITLTGALGTLSMNGTTGAITGAAGTAFNLSGGTANVTYAGTITQNAAQFAVAATSMTGGTKTFSGNITSITSGRGISLTTNTGATVAFTGGLSLSTGTNPAFTATGGGTVTATQNNTTIVNTLTTTTGTALNVASTTIGAAGLTFRSVSANGGANGIVLNTTGASGGLTVTGNGGNCTPGDTTCTGGTIQNMTGGDDSSTTPSGTGIVLNSTQAPSLTRMRIRANSNYGIRGTTVSGFTLDNCLLDGVNGTNASTPFNDGSISFDNLTGSATVSNSNIQGGVANNFRLVNTSGTLNRITFTSVTFDVNGSNPANDALTLESQGAAVVNVTVQNSFFKSAAGDLFQLNNIGTGADDLIFTGNTLTNAHPAIATGGGGVTIGSNGTGNITSNFSTNTLRDSIGHAILFFKSTGAANVTGTFNANTIGVSGVANSGSAEGDGLKVQNAGQGTVKVTITNNQIRQYNNFGIQLLTGGGATLQPGALNATITGNTIAQPGNTAGSLVIAKNGIHVNDGTVPGDTYLVCAEIGGAGGLANAITGSGADSVPPSGLGNIDFRLRQRQATTLRLPSYGGANNDNAAAVAFVSGNNGGASGLASNTVPTGGGFTGGAGACP